MLEMRNLMKLFGLQGVPTYIMPLFGVRVSLYTCRSCGWLSLTEDRRKQEGQGTHGLLDEETRKLASEGLHGCFDNMLHYRTCRGIEIQEVSGFSLSVLD